MRNAVVISIAVIALLLGAAAGYLVSASTYQHTTTSISTATTTSSTTTTTSVLVTKTAMGTNGYHSDNVTNDIAVVSEGYIFLLNNSIRFEGVTFTTLCPGVPGGCGYQLTATRVAGIPSAGWIELQMVFPDGKNETLVSNVGSSDYTVLLSEHTNPTGGIALQFVPQNSQYDVFLLVSQ